MRSSRWRSTHALRRRHSPEPSVRASWGPGRWRELDECQRAAECPGVGDRSRHSLHALRRHRCGRVQATDGGQSWAAANAGLTGAPQITVNALAIRSGSPATLYAATSGGVFKTIDGAANWTSISVGLAGLTPRLLAIDPSSSSTLYVGVDDYVNYIRYGVFKSSDAGTSWTMVYTTPVVDFEDGSYALSVAALAVAPLRRLVCISWWAAAWCGAWMAVRVGREVVGPPANLSSLAVDPTSSTTIYAGTHAGTILRTIDAGDHLTIVADSPLLTTAVNVIAVTASAPSMIYAGSGSGIYRSSDSGANWSHSPTGARNTRVYPLAVDPTAPSTIYTAYNDVAGVFTKTTDGGGHWIDSALGVAGQTVNSLVIDPASPTTLYAGMGAAGSGANVYKSTDAGAHWVPLTKGMFAMDVQALAIAPSRSSTLYAGMAEAGVFKSGDRGASWTLVNNGLTAIGTDVSALAVDPTDADVVYVATPPAGRPPVTDAKIFKSTNGAAQWKQVPLHCRRRQPSPRWSSIPPRRRRFTPPTLITRRVLAAYSRAATAVNRGPRLRTIFPPCGAWHWQSIPTRPRKSSRPRKAAYSGVPIPRRVGRH